ncbi:MAG TPA: type II toxin-antitoxin system HicA family toxin [Segetibacter sp.]|jgi:predicted RNA binding protein YcfA (HicA-like mRNA interferase family)
MKSSELVRKFNQAGWIEVRQTGSHKIFKHPVSGDTISVPFHGSKEVPTGTAKAILKKAGFK